VSMPMRRSWADLLTLDSVGIPAAISRGCDPFQNVFFFIL
jgi:hypothetical protein